MKPKIATIGLAHPFEVGFDQAENLLNQTSDALEKMDVECIRTNVVMHDYDTVKQAAEALRGVDFDVALIAVATWSEDHHLLDLLSFIDMPMILRAYRHHDTGSLCCCHQIGAVFTELDRGYDFVYGDADDMDCAKKTVQIATAYALANKMNRLKAGAIGGRVKGMTEIAYDEFDIKAKLGARIINIDEMELLDYVEEATDSEAQELLDKWDFEGRGYTVSSDQDSLIESAKYYIAMKKLCDEYDMGAFAVKCYTKYMGKVCLGYSVLAEEEGIMGGCEGDVTNSIGMKMLYELSKKPVNNTDLLFLDTDENTILYAHCGSSGFSIADEEVEIGPVRLAEQGCCSLFTAMPGEVTLVNIVGHGEKFRLSVMTGMAVPTGMEFPGNPVKVKHDRPVLEISEEIMRHGIGHHWMVGYGNYVEELRQFCKIKDIDFYEI